MRKILMKLITAKATLEHFGGYDGKEMEWYIADAIMDIDNAINEIMRKYEKYEGDDDDN